MELSQIVLEESEALIQSSTYSVLGLLKNDSNAKTLSYIKDEEYMSLLRRNHNVCCIVCRSDLINQLPQHVKGIIVSEAPEYTFWKIHNQYGDERNKYKTVIGENCTIHKMACISPYNVKIGNNVVIEEFVSIKENVEIGDNVIIRAGSIIGTSGFENKVLATGSILPVIHYGGVRIEKNVEIMSSVVIDKAVFSQDNTVISEGTKIGSLSMIAHNAHVGKDCRITVGVVVAGSVIINDNVWIGPNAAISNGVQVGNCAAITIGSTVVSRVKDNKRVTGNFALEHELFLQSMKRQIEGD